MGQGEIYKQTHRRTTDEYENDEQDINTKNVLLYGWDFSASAKVRLNVTSAGTGVTI